MMRRRPARVHNLDHGPLQIMLHICEDHVISAYLCRAFIILAVHSSLLSFSLVWKSEGAPVGILRREIWPKFNLRHNKRWRRDIANNGHDSGAGLGIWETRDGISGSSTGSGSSVQWDQGYQERSLMAMASRNWTFLKNQFSKLKLKYLVLQYDRLELD